MVSVSYFEFFSCQEPFSHLLIFPTFVIKYILLSCMERFTNMFTEVFGNCYICMVDIYITYITYAMYPILSHFVAQILQTFTLHRAVFSYREYQNIVSHIWRHE